MKKSAVTLIPGPSNAPPDNFSSVSPRPCHPPRLCHPPGLCHPPHQEGVHRYPALLTYVPLADFLLKLFQNSFYFSYILYSILLPFLNKLTSIHLPSSLSLPPPELTSGFLKHLLHGSSCFLSFSKPFPLRARGCKINF